MQSKDFVHFCVVCSNRSFILLRLGVSSSCDFCLYLINLS